MESVFKIMPTKLRIRKKEWVYYLIKDIPPKLRIPNREWTYYCLFKSEFKKPHR